jgi:endo-beta-N-acetylglucosaminidase D
LDEVEEAKETDELLLSTSMETEDKTKIKLETEETKERDKVSQCVSMEEEEKLYNDYRRKWEKSWSSKSGGCGRFEDTSELTCICLVFLMMLLIFLLHSTISSRQVPH